MLKNRPRARLLHAIATAFLLTTSLTAANLVAANVAIAQSNDDYAEQFYAAGYSNCDAEKLGYYWQMSQWDAKVRAGWKIWWGKQDLVDGDLGVAISQYYCVNNSFNMDDATKLAGLWSAAPSS